jgi:hypothetical protein
MSMHSGFRNRLGAWFDRPVHLLFRRLTDPTTTGLTAEI